MKKTIIEAALLSTVISLMFACGPKKEEPVAAPMIDKEKIKQEIQDRENQFAELYNKAEVKNIGYYADEAITYAQNRAPLVGKPAILEYLKAGIESSSKGNKISFTTHEVFVSGDANQVVELGYFQLVDSTDVVINRGNYMVLFEKRDSVYSVVREMSASDIPLE